MTAPVLVTGAFVGFLAGLLGIGGGMLMVPFMTFVLTSKGMPTQYVVKMAIATSLAPSRSRERSAIVPIVSHIAMS